MVALIPFVYTACKQPQKKPTEKPADSLRSAVVQSPGPGTVDTSIVYTSDIYKQYIPADIDSVIKQQLPEWSLPEPGSWEKLWFNMYKKDSVLINYITGDFNGDRKKDYALILNKGKNIFAVWVIQSDGNVYKAIKLHEIKTEQTPIDMGIEFVSKGKLGYIDFDSGKEPKPIDLKNPAIQVVFFEQSAETYYWKNGEYQSVTTGD